MNELLVRGGLIIDGSGQPAYPGHVIIKNGRCDGIITGEAPSDEGRQVIDAAGLAVAPGFIDIHSHSDLSILANPRCESSLQQGITTEIAGNCGWSMAPVHHAAVERLAKTLVAGLAGVPRDSTDLAWTWTTMAEFLEQVESRGCGVNFGSYVGQSMVRAYVIGGDDRAGTADEVRKMRRLVEQALADGAFGLSTGRSYVPGKYAGTDEIVELSRPLGPAGGLYTSHIADQKERVVAATEEVAEIGLRARCAVQVAHQKVCTKACFGRAGDALAVMDRARGRGVDIASDVYPWLYTQLFTLSRALPRWATDGSVDAACARLRDPDVRRRLIEGDSRSGSASLAETAARMARDGVIHCRLTHHYEGMELGEVAAAKGLPLVDALCELLAENELAVKTAGLMSEADLIAILKHPLAMVSTDAFTLDRPLPEEESVHPRHYGTYPQVLGRYVRELGALTLEEAVRKMTAAPAARVGLTDRGRIRAGCAADLVIFDPATIANTSTAAEPASFPVGIAWVIVNGRLAVDHGRLTETRAGHVLRRS
ncbi:MAG: N-acyl-D-amino-acid deacylase family protein [Chloroflexota bacterium]